MKTTLTHKIKLSPDNAQANFLARSCGTSRFGYNLGLETWEKMHKEGDKPSMFKVKKEVNAIKKAFGWVYDVSKCCIEEAIRDLGKAYSNFFRNPKHFGKPNFKKKGVKDSFRLNNQNFKCLGDSHIRIAKLKKPIRLREPLRFNGKIISCTLSKKAGKWFASINVEVDWNIPTSIDQEPRFVGVDLGIKSLAVCSNGMVFDGLTPHKQALKKLRKLNKGLSRKVKGSKNFEKAKLRLAKLHAKIANIRSDYLHKVTTYLAKNFSVITIEDLNVSGMSKNPKLARSILEGGFGLFKTMLEYKTKLYGPTLVVADRFFPSTKTCSSCGQIHDMPLHKRRMKCDCGNEIDSDLNAAINLERYGIKAVGSPA